METTPTPKKKRLSYIVIGLIVIGLGYMYYTSKNTCEVAPVATDSTIVVPTPTVVVSATVTADSASVDTSKK